MEIFVNSPLLILNRHVVLFKVENMLFLWFDLSDISYIVKLTSWLIFKLENQEATPSFWQGPLPYLVMFINTFKHYFILGNARSTKVSIYYDLTVTFLSPLFHGYYLFFLSDLHVILFLILTLVTICTRDVRYQRCTKLKIENNVSLLVDISINRCLDLHTCCNSDQQSSSNIFWLNRTS